MKAFAEIINRIAKLETRMGNMVRYGTVSQVDAAKKKMRLRLGSSDEDAFLSPWVSYSQTAGALKIHTPPSVGQQFAMFSDNGNLKQAVAMPFTWKDGNESPSDLGNEHVLTYGSVKMAIRDKQAIIEVGGAKIDVTDQKITFELGGTKVELEAGNFKVAAQQVDWTI